MDTEMVADDYSKAWLDWLATLGRSPEQQAQLMQSAAHKWQDTWNFATQALGGAPLAPSKTDRQFANEAWSQWPFNVYAHAYGNMVGWWNEALSLKQQLPADSAQRLDFSARQMLAASSPANFLHTNPELLKQTHEEQGANLIRGTVHWLEDMRRMLERTPAPGTEKFRVGEAVAVTPGKVVFRNELMELIQYSAQTTSVFAEPVLITPAWIMKYYILDLSPHNSLVRYLVEQGHTVFMISWKNPTAADATLGMDDYVRLGFDAALDAVTRIVPDRKVHSVGYCIGGTLLSIAAAEQMRRGDTRIASVTLFAAQTDFSEAGELSVFITPGQLAALDQKMKQAGVLTSEEMGMSFALLRSADLVWAPSVNTYLRGRRESLNDLMAWNADGTRMPCRMHSEYLSRLYLNNELARGQFPLAGETIDLGRIQAPMFVVGTQTDHVAPWRSVYKVRSLTNSDDYTFLLTSGGHNAGIVSDLGHAGRSYQVATKSNGDQYLDPDGWAATAPRKQGSWWPEWVSWLKQRSSPLGQLPQLGATAKGLPPLGDAPGSYVFQD